MQPLLVPYLAACLLLLAAGAGKLRSPAGASQALRTQRLPSSPVLVRALGLAEVALAVAALLEVPGTPVLVALAYAGFTAFVGAALLRGGPLSSCGCFGEPDLPPTPLHVVVTGLLAACAAAVAAGPAAGLPSLGDDGALVAVGAAASAGLLAWLAVLVLSALPRLTAARALVAPLRPAAGSTAP